MNNTPCSECQANGQHSPLCSKIDLEGAKKQLRQYYDLWLSKEIWTRKRCDGYKKHAHYWKGKFYEVKHENNKLRKRKYNQ